MSLSEMSLLDHFAAKAMQALIQSCNVNVDSSCHRIQEMARCAYLVAECMIDERDSVDEPVVLGRG